MTWRFEIARIQRNLRPFPEQEIAPLIAIQPRNYLRAPLL